MFDPTLDVAALLVAAVLAAIVVAAIHHSPTPPPPSAAPAAPASLIPRQRRGSHRARTVAPQSRPAWTDPPTGPIRRITSTGTGRHAAQPRPARFLPGTVGVTSLLRANSGDAA